MLKTAGRISDRLVEAAAVVLLLTMLATVSLGVAFRLAGEPLAWSDELAQYLLVWTAFTGWIIASRRRSHIRIGLIVDRLKGLPRRLVEVAIQMLVATLGVVLLIKSFGLIGRNADVEWVSLPLSVALVYIPMPIAGLAVILQAALQAIEALRGKADADASQELLL
ncbi:TRAP transporter small permease [Mesorhizobium sp. WSM2239]|uniref:TRAP transporter small permease protein n=2 Tax=unclassified Mesorhizobium TaxID=325217 RepID=A0AAU8DFQ7_9HYPH